MAILFGLGVGWKKRAKKVKNGCWFFRAKKVVNFKRVEHEKVIAVLRQNGPCLCLTVGYFG